MPQWRHASAVETGRQRPVLHCFWVPMLSVVIAMLWALRSGWVPRSDRAFVQLRLFDVFRREVPLVGMPSTLSESTGATAHHLGPGQFWVLAVPFRVISSITDSATSLAMAAALVSVVAILAVAWSVSSVGASTRERWAACGFLAATLWQATVATTASPWNPDFSFVMLASATTICVAVAVRGPTLTATSSVVVLASLAAQAHLSFLLPSIALIAVVALYTLRAATFDRRRWSVLAVVLVATWIGPLIDVVVHRGGNISAILSSPSVAGGGVVSGFDRFAHSLLPWRFGFQQPHDGGYFVKTATWIDRLVAASALGAVIAVVARNGRVRHLGVVALSMVGATIAGATITPNTFATLFAAHVQRVWIVPTLLVWATIGVGGLQLAARRSGWSQRRRGTVVVALSAVPMVALLSSAVLFGDRPGSVDFSCSSAVTELAAVVIDEARDGDIYDSTAISFDGIGPALDVSTGLYAELVRQGADLQLVAESSPSMISNRYFESRAASEPATFIISKGPSTPITSARALAVATCDTPTESVTVSVHLTGR